MPDDRIAEPAVAVGRPALASVVLFLLVMFLLGNLRAGLPGSGLFDPDSYARMLRIERLLSGAGWYDNAVPWANAPYDGPTLHWSRPFDALVAAGAIPLSLITNRRAAVIAAGSAAPLILGVASLLAIAWGSRRMIGPRGWILLGLLVPAQPTLAHVFKWSYVDHHGLIAMLFAVGWAGTIRALDGDSPRPARVAGIAAGLSLWVTVESIGWVFTAAGAIGLLWIREGTRAHLRTVATFFTAAAVTSSIALVLERAPADWLSLEMDRLSIPWVMLVIATAVSWTVAGRLTGEWADRSSSVRFGIGLAAFAVPAAITTAMIPKLLHGPVADVDPLTLPLLFEGNAEFSHFTTSDLLYLATLAGAVVPTIIASAYSIMRLRSADRRVARVAMLTLVFVALFLPLTLYQWRWAIYLNVVAPLPWVLAIRDVIRPHAGARPSRRLAAIAFAVALATGHFIIAVALARANLAQVRRAQSAPAARSDVTSQEPATRRSTAGRPRRSRGLARVQCSYAGLGDALAGLSHRTPESLIVMTTMYDGPQMAWQAGVRVVGSPYHRNDSGILDTDTVMAKADAAAARRVLDSRGVDYVALCEKGTTTAVMLEKAPDGLAARLVRGDVPPWLAPVSLPSNIDPGLGVYEVRHATR